MVSVSKRAVSLLFTKPFGYHRPAPPSRISPITASRPRASHTISTHTNTAIPDVIIKSIHRPLPVPPVVAPPCLETTEPVSRLILAPVFLLVPMQRLFLRGAIRCKERFSGISFNSPPSCFSKKISFKKISTLVVGI